MPSILNSTISLSLGDVELRLTSKSPPACDRGGADKVAHDGVSSAYDSFSISKNCYGEISIDLNKFVGTLLIKDRTVGGASTDKPRLDATPAKKKKRAANNASNKRPAAKRAKKDHVNHLKVEGATKVGDGSEDGIVSKTETNQEQAHSSKRAPCLNMTAETLHELWNEYQFGTNGWKAAKDFTEIEQTPVKKLYDLRMVFWSKCVDMINFGMSVDDAICHIYEAYAPTTNLESILVKMKIDKKKGWKSLPLPPNATHAFLEEGFPATLSPSPKHLLLLWEEYTNGINGRKPARLFTPKERNRIRKVKQNYYRRNIIWKVMEKQVEAGLTPMQAVRELYDVYGADTSITQISNKIVTESILYPENGGFNPRLTVKLDDLPEGSRTTVKSPTVKDCTWHS